MTVAALNQKIKVIIDTHQQGTAIASTNKELSLLDKNFAKVGTAAQAAMAGVALAAVAALGAGLHHASRTAADFEHSMQRVGALSRTIGTQDFKQLTEAAKELGRTTSFSASQAAEGMQALAMAGFSANKIIASMPGILAAAAAGQTELGQTANIVSNIMSAFGVEADRTAEVVDVLTATFTSSNTTLETLGETMKFVGPVAKANGQSLEVMAAAAGLLGQAGIPASLAGTALRGTLIRLAAPSGKAAELIKELGIQTRDAAGQMLPMPTLIQNLQSALETLDPAEQSQAIKELIGMEAMAGFQVLLDAGPEKFAAYADKLKNEFGIAIKVAGESMDTTKGATIELSSALEGLSILIGDKVNPALRLLIEEALLPTVRGLSDIIEEEKVLETAFIGLTRVASLAINPMGLLTEASMALLGGLVGDAEAAATVTEATEQTAKKVTAAAVATNEYSQALKENKTALVANKAAEEEREAFSRKAFAEGFKNLRKDSFTIGEKAGVSLMLGIKQSIQVLNDVDLIDPFDFASVRAGDAFTQGFDDTLTEGIYRILNGEGLASTLSDFGEGFKGYMIFAMSREFSTEITKEFETPLRAFADASMNTVKDRFAGGASILGKGFSKAFKGIFESSGGDPGIDDSFFDTRLKPLFDNGGAKLGTALGKGFGAGLTTWFGLNLIEDILDVEIPKEVKIGLTLADSINMATGGAAGAWVVTQGLDLGKKLIGGFGKEFDGFFGIEDAGIDSGYVGGVKKGLNAGLSVAGKAGDDMGKGLALGVKQGISGFFDVADAGIDSGYIGILKSGMSSNLGFVGDMGKDVGRGFIGGLGKQMDAYFDISDAGIDSSYVGKLKKGLGTGVGAVAGTGGAIGGKLIDDIGAFFGLDDTSGKLSGHLGTVFEKLVTGGAAGADGAAFLLGKVFVDGLGNKIIGTENTDAIKASMKEFWTKYVTDNSAAADGVGALLGNVIAGGLSTYFLGKSLQALGVEIDDRVIITASIATAGLELFPTGSPEEKALQDNLGKVVRNGFIAANIAALFAPNQQIGIALGASLGTLIGLAIAPVGPTLGAVIGGALGGLMELVAFGSSNFKEDYEKQSAQEFSAILTQTGGVRGLVETAGSAAGVGGFLRDQGFIVLADAIATKNFLDNPIRDALVASGSTRNEAQTVVEQIKAGAGQFALPGDKLFDISGFSATKFKDDAAKEEKRLKDQEAKGAAAGLRPGDLGGNPNINFEDFFKFGDDFGKSGVLGFSPSDFDSSGTVDIDDFFLFAEAFNRGQDSISNRVTSTSTLSVSEIVDGIIKGNLIIRDGAVWNLGGQKVGKIKIGNGTTDTSTVNLKIAGGAISPAAPPALSPAGLTAADIFNINPGGALSAAEIASRVNSGSLTIDGTRIMNHFGQRIADIAGVPGFANGFNGVVSQPTLMMVGEAGPESVTVTPHTRPATGPGFQGGAHNSSTGQTVNHFNIHIHANDTQSVRAFAEDELWPLLQQYMRRDGVLGRGFIPEQAIIKGAA